MLIVDCCFLCVVYVHDFLFIWKGLQPVLHQSVCHGIFTVLMCKLEFMISQFQILKILI